jgi:hypothetical protein
MTHHIPRDKMTIGDVRLSDPLIGMWMTMYIKACSKRVPLAQIIETNETFANVFRIAALAASPGNDQAMLLHALDEDLVGCQASLSQRNSHYGALAAIGRDALRSALHGELPKRIRTKISAPATCSI